MRSVVNTGPRITPSFTRLDLLAPSADDGYAMVEVSLADAVKGIVKGALRPRPIVVWLYSPEESELSDACEAHLDGDEEAALSLSLFDCRRVNVDSIRTESYRKALGETPGYIFFDPSGAETARLSGEKAADCTSFEGVLERAWRASFVSPRRKFVKAMQDVLDGRDRLSAKRAAIDDDRNRLRDRPNPRKEQALAADLAALEKELEKLFDVERATRDSVDLRAEFQPKKAVEETVRSR